MNSIFKDFIGIFKFIQDTFAGVRKFFTPPKAFSWQTLIYLSIYSWGLSLIATDAVQDIIAFFGWLFLIFGTAWYTTDDPLRVPGTFMPVGALITGFLVSVLALGDQEIGVTPRTIVLWPTIAALITAAPEFFVGSGTSTKVQLPKVQERQKIIVLLAWSMLISCWIQFYFVIDKWIKDYPSLEVENFQRSTFVVKLDIPLIPNRPRNNGVRILNQIQPLIEEQIVNQPWSNVEKWLQFANKNVGNLAQDILTKNLAKYEEKGLWRVEPRVTNVSAGYKLDILTIWKGPSTNTQGYYIRKSCVIQPVKSSKGIVAEINCERRARLINGSPPPQE